MTKISSRLALTALACALAAPGAMAQVFKCVDAVGKVSFVDQPCTGTQKSGEVKIYAGPAAPSPAPAAAQAPGMSAAAVAHEKERQQRRAQSDESHMRIDESTVKVTKMRADNADPAKCKEARAKMAIMEKRDPLTFKLDVSYFEYQQAASLHCRK